MDSPLSLDTATSSSYSRVKSEDVMTIAKAKIENILERMPATIDVEDLIYQLYLLEKLEEGEQDIREGRILSHDQAIERISEKWQN